MHGLGTMFKLDDQLKDKIYYTNSIGGGFDSDVITDLPKDKVLVADFSGDPWGAGSYSVNNIYDKFYETLENLGFNFILLSHLPTDHLRRPRLIHYQPFNFYGQEYFDRITPLTDIKKYKISCLNLNPHTHRIKNYLSFKRKAYFNECLFSFHTAKPEDLHQHYAKLTPEMELEWLSIMPELPSRYELMAQLRGASGSDTIVHDAYTDSYINLVTESSVAPGLFISEKTWKPVAAGQLFLIFGSPGSITYLREQGVDTFDDVINHDFYDGEQDWEARLNKIHTLIDELVTQDLAKIYQDTKERRHRNQKKFFDGEFDNGFFNDLKLAITRYSCINTPN